MSIVQELETGTGSAEVRRINPDEVDERHERAWLEHEQLYPRPSEARVATLERLEERARRLLVFARDLDERAREERLQVRRIKDALEMKRRLSAPRPVRPDPAELERLATTERNATRLAAQAEATSVRAQAARQIADGCRRYLYAEQIGGLGDVRFTMGGKRA
jgi:hypothetical protein